MIAGFQAQDFMHLTFPVQMFIDYIRVYQREDVISEDSTSCPPSSHPTAEYINRCVAALLPPRLRLLTLGADNCQSPERVLEP